jgi:hypothetical protein
MNDIGFDSTIEKSRAIRELINKCNYYSEIKDYDNWKNTIYTLDRELSSGTTEEEYKLINVQYNKISEKQSELTGAYTQSPQRRKSIGEMMNILHDTEKILRKIADRQEKKNFK